MPPLVGVITMRVESTTRTSQSRVPVEPTGAVSVRIFSTAASSCAGSRTKKLSEPLAVEISPMSTGCGAIRRISARIVSSIAVRRDLATSAVSASSRMWLPPARSSPRLMRGAKPSPICLAVDSGIRLGTESRIPNSSAPMIEAIFQRGKSSMTPSAPLSVVGGLGRPAHLGERGLDRTDADVGREFDLHLVAIDLADAAYQTAAGDRDIALLHRFDHLLVLLHARLLRTDQQEVEDHHHQDDGDETRIGGEAGRSGRGACSLGISWGREHRAVRPGWGALSQKKCCPGGARAPTMLLPHHARRALLCPLAKRAASA